MTATERSAFSLTRQEQADHLRELGFEVFPCYGNPNSPKFKKPRVNSWKDSDENNAAKFAANDLIAIRLIGDVVVLDVDRAKQFAALGLELPATLTVQTLGKNRGTHYFYVTDGRDVLQVVDITKTVGFDTRVGDKGYVIAWDPENMTPPSQWAAAPEWMYALVKDRPADTTPDGEPPVFTSRDQLLRYFGTFAKVWSLPQPEWYALLFAMRATGRLVALDENDPWTDADLHQLASEFVKWQERPYFTTADTTDQTTELFGPLMPLDTPYCDAEFPRGVLPSWADDLAEQMTTALQVPSGAVEMAMLGGFSAAVQGRLEIIPNDGYRELAVLWVAVAMLSGERKSAISDGVYAPLYRWEADYNRTNATAISRSAALVAYHEEQVVLWRQQSRKVNMTDTERYAAQADLIKAKWELDSLVRVSELSVIADDVTPEALAVMMDANHQNAAINSTEGGVFDTFSGRYNNKVNTDLVLKAYSGDPSKQDRVSRSPLRFSRPTVTFAVTVQPTVLVEIGSNPQLRGNGFLARFLYAVPPPRFGHRDIRVRAVDDDVTQTYTQQLYGIADSVSSLRDSDAVATVYFSDDAAEARFAYAESVEKRLANGGDLADLGQWGSKLVGQVVRIAGLLHYAENNGKGFIAKVSLDTFNRALDVSDYLTAHAQSAYLMMNGKSSPAAAQRLLDHMERYRDENSGRFTYRDLKRRLHFDDSELDYALAVLFDHGYARPVEPPQTNGRPTKGSVELRPR